MVTTGVNKLKTDQKLNSFVFSIGTQTNDDGSFILLWV